MVGERLIIAQQGVGQSPGVIAPLHAAHHLGHGIVHDTDAGFHGLGREEQLLVAVDDGSHLPGFHGPVGEGSIEVDQPVASGFIAGRHRVISINVNAFGSLGDGRPGPYTVVGGSHRVAHQQGNGAHTSLQFADIPAPFFTVGAAGKVGGGAQGSQRPSPVGLVVLGIHGYPVVVKGPGHQEIIGSAGAHMGRLEKGGPHSMGGDQVSGVTLADSLVTGSHVIH